MLLNRIEDTTVLVNDDPGTVSRTIVKSAGYSEL